jgi:serine/threonine-protein phosphatase 2A regulatory subunit B
MNLFYDYLDIVDIKPPNMEDLTEVITGAEFHPRECNLFVYSSSRGIIRLCDMRQSALCDRHCKGKRKKSPEILFIYLFSF